LLREIARKNAQFQIDNTFFQIDNFKSQLSQITTKILVKKNSFSKKIFPYFWSLNKKKQFAHFYAQLHEFTPL
jgi:hypothetical protein